MITVYWSPWYGNATTYNENYLTHYELDNVYSDLLAHKDPQNVRDNFFNCYAFKDFLKNMYCLRNPYSVDFRYENGNCISNVPPKAVYDLSVTSQVKASSVKDALTINYGASWIFFADKPLKIQTMHPWMHGTEASKTSFYVPGSFDISKWFRPIETACQLFPGENTFKSDEGEPLIYINFLTDEKIVLKKFYLTQDIINLSMSCLKLKYFKSFKALNYLYKVFTQSKLKNRILSEIKKNVIEE